MKEVECVKCNKCNDVLFTNKKCSCGSLGFIKNDKFMFIYSDDNDFTYSTAFVENDRLIKLNKSIVYDLGYTLYLPDDVIKELI